MQADVTKFGRFYASLAELPYGGDREELKRALVLQYTGDRTASLHEMTRAEYDECCTALEKLTGRRDRLKRARSVSLHIMQAIGVNTADWSAIDNFCLNARIFGKRFRDITLSEHRALQRKLRAIERGGGLRDHHAEAVRTAYDRRAFTVQIMEGGEA